MSSSKKKPEVDRGEAVEDADTSLALSDQSNQQAEQDTVEKTHPLPTDLNKQGVDSTGGNAPFAPADITPANDDGDAQDNSGTTGDTHGTSRRSE